MKLIHFIAIGLILCSQAFAQQKSQKFAIKSGYITYKLSGNTQGTKSVWWDDYGHKTRTEINSVTETRMMGFTSKEEANTIDIIVNDKYWHVDKKENSGQKGTLPYYNEAIEIAENMTEAEQKELADQIINSMGGERLGTENVMGYNCEVVSIMGIKSWIYKGIVLKISGQVMGIKTHEEVVKLETNISVPSSKFQPVSGITYEDIDAMQQGMYGGGMYDNDSDADNDYESDGNNSPVDYPFGKFQNAVNGFSKSGYRKMMVQNTDGQHMAMFMKGMTGSLTIVASSMENGNSGDHEGYEKFSHNGRTCYYGNMEDGDGVALIVEYKEHNTYIVFASMPSGDKTTLLEIHDSIKF